MLIILVCVPNYRNGIDQENFYLHKKAEIAGKGIGYSRGMGRVSFQNSYQVWTMLELLSILEPYLELLYSDGL
jgi:hypothetical protein